MLHGSLRPSSAVIALVLIVACERAIDRVVGPAESPERSVRGSQSIGNGEVRTVFGPRLLVRGTGAPITESMTLEGFATEATLRIANGDASGSGRVSSGTVFVDGQEVVRPSDFGQQVAFIVVPITLQNTSVISVRLASAPGDQVTLSVEGRLAMSATVTSAGGTLHLLGSQVTLVAPAGAVGGSVQLSAEPVTAPRPEAVPGTSVEMGPTGTAFSTPVTLSIAYDPAALPVGVRPASLRMHWWNADHWEALAGNAVDEARAVVSARTAHFTTFALLPNEVVFCPGDAGAESDLRTAITHVPDNGTVYVCDGTFPVAQVLIDKPLTLRSLNVGGATLTETEPGGPNQVLVVNGVTSGVVRITDIGIVMVDEGIRPGGTFDKVELDNVRFSGATGSQSRAVVVGPSSVSGARVDVTNSDFSQLYLGVWPIGAVETNVSNSRFDRFGAGAVVYSHGNTSTTQSFGRTEDNTFTNCGSGGCVRVLTAGEVVVARNRFEAMDQPVTTGAITVSTGLAYPNASPTIIEDNVIISRRTGSPESTPAGWMFQSGISLTDPNVRTAVVRRNRVTDVYSGVTSTASVSATDNWFTGGVYAIRQTAMREVTFQRNDMSGLLGSFTTPLAGSSFQCNWWGSTGGPTAPPSGTQWAYSPWAGEPIAGTSVACNTTPVPPVPPVAVITVSPNPFAILPGGTQQFTATGRDANNNVVPIAPIWAVTNGGGSINSSGLFTAGEAPGTFANTVRATSGAVSGSATVAVGQIASVVVTPNPATVIVGGTQQFFASPRDANGYQMNPPITRVWSVADGGGSIGATGLFTAGTMTGTFANTVTVAYGTVTGTATVNVATPPATITVAPSATVILAGASKQFVATARDANGNVVPISPTWSVVSGGGTINQGGVFVAGGAVGTFTNTVKATVGPTYGTATVSVVNQVPTDVRVCATPGAEVTVPTVSDAVALVASGGTVKLCDGSHVANSLSITKPVTITAEGPGIPTVDAGPQASSWLVSSTVSGAVTVSNLRFKGYQVSANSASTDATLSVEGTSFEDCGTYTCIATSLSSRIINNTFTAHIEKPQSSAIVLGAQQGTLPQTYTVTDNTIIGIGNDSAQANWWARYSMTSAAIYVLSGVAEVARNRVTNAFWGIIASPYPSRPPLTMTAVDNVVQATYFPIGRIGQYGYAGSVTMNWNDVSDYSYLSSDSSAGVLNLRCNWWARTAGPTNVGSWAMKYYTPWASSPVAGQPHVDCDPTGAALASITVTPNPDTLVAGGTQQFVATGRDGNGTVVSVTPTWSVVNGGGTIDANAGLFTASTSTGTWGNTVKATSGLVSGTATVVLTQPPLVPVVRVCATAGDGVTVPTLLQALNRVASGGTIKLCDGTHVESHVSVSTPVTITAEGPGMPVVQGNSQGAVIFVSGRTPGTVTISKLSLRDIAIAIDSGSGGALLVVEDNEFAGCMYFYCVTAATTARIARNSITVRYENQVESPIRLGVYDGLPASTTYSVTDNSITGIGNDFSRTSVWDQYSTRGAAITVFSGTVAVARNRITNTAQGISAGAGSGFLGYSVQATDNVIRSTSTPFAAFGAGSTVQSFVASWNDILEATHEFGGPLLGAVNLRCNWWGQASGPTASDPAVPPSVYTPFTLSPAAGQPRIGCTP